MVTVCSALGNHILEKEVDFMRDIVILMHVKSPELRGKSLSQPRSQLQQLSKAVDISFTPDYADHVFEQTLQQSQSEAWRIHR
jgi:predicted metalloenzyme YecM